MCEIIVEFPSKLTEKEKKMVYGYKGELTRCKDCKWWGLSDHNTLGIHTCKKYSGVRFESDYCSRAERSEDGEA